MRIYKDNGEYLQDVLKYVKTAVFHYHCARTLKNPDSTYAFRDKVLRPEDILRLLEPDFDEDALGEYNKCLAELAELRDMLRRNGRASMEKGVFLPLEYIAQVLQLDDFIFHSLCLAISSDLDRRFERIWGFLQDDLNLRRPSVDMAARMFTSEPAEITEAVAIFAALDMSASMLFDAGTRKKTVPSQILQAGERVTAFILGGLLLPEEKRKTLGITYLSAIEEMPRLLYGFKTDGELAELHRGLPDGMCTLIQLYGAPGSGKKLLTRRFAALGQQGVIFVNLSAFGRAEEREEALRALSLEVCIQQCMVAITHVDEWFELISALGKESLKPAWELLSGLINALKPFTLAIFVHTNKEYKLSGHMPGFHFRHMSVGSPNSGERLEIWRELTKDIRFSEDVDLEAVAGKYALTPGLIESAVQDAGAAGAEVSGELLNAACQRQLVHGLENHARKIPAIFTWDDLVLPSEPLMLLKRAVNQIKFRRVVMEDWGFREKLPYGRGMSLLFSGASGTGKTMSAQVIARELGLELYKVDLSCVVSKYIGETEQNLRRVFDEAEKSQVILFFDEADSLFGKRTEVKDSHDRNANMEVSFLLQKLEEHDGIVILSTNFLQNVDVAFKRRIHYLIEFPMPDAAQRLLLWKSMFPKSAPPSDRIDFEFLAKNFDLSGSNIKSIVILAAYDASSKGEIIAMSHIVNAMRIESKKLGKLLMATDFAEYGHYCTPW